MFVPLSQAHLLTVLYVVRKAGLKEAVAARVVGGCEIVFHQECFDVSREVGLDQILTHHINTARQTAEKSVCKTSSVWNMN